jgi:hypothetical protein
MADNLSAFVTVNRQFLRSVRLDADLGRADALHGYVLQPSARMVLETMAKHVTHTQQRAFTWTGPYGGGKSSLALALASLASTDAKVRKHARTTLDLPAHDPVQKAFGSGAPWEVLTLVGRRASIVDDLGACLDQHFRGIRGRRAQVNGRRDVVGELVRAAETRTELGGVLLVIDELGKYLEFAAHTGEDIGLYQDLAEAASRCNGNLVVIGVLHQAFEQYATRLGQEVRQEWAKVQGRYVDIPLVAGSDEVLGLIGRALNTNLPHDGSAKTAARVAKVIRLRRPSAAADIAHLLDACWPLHPVTAAMLGPASKKRFGQNERSVFSFLASAEPLGFSEVLKGLPADADSYFWPAQFWDYLRINFEPSILASTDGHRWASCAEAIERTESRFSPLHVALVKTVGLIELFRNGSGLAAEKDLLKTCVGSEVAGGVEGALNELSSASILIYRKHLGAYGVFAGSDFDIEAAVRDARLQIGPYDLSRLASLIDLGPVTARRHYWITGAMRWFSRAIVREDQLERYAGRAERSGPQCGEFVLVIGSHQNGRMDAIAKVAKRLSATVASNGLMIGIPRNSDRIEELVGDLAALEYVRTNSRELHGDTIAVAEVNARLRSTRTELADELRDTFQRAAWYYDGQLVNPANARAHSLSQIASEIADHLYTEAPHVHSELVNRNELSTAAAKAQRELLHRMLTSSTQPNLGYQEFSADAGLYYTVVRSLGLHRNIKVEWRFTDPAATDRSKSLQPAWDKAKEVVFQSERLISLSELYAAWQAKPFGIKSGLLPVFALSLFLAHRHQLALYLDGVFTPEVTEAHVDEWLQDPSRVEWRFVRIDSSERRMLQSLSQALAERLGRPVAADALDSARALVALVYQLPAWTRRTETLSPGAKSVRRLLLTASDPHKVLFADLPLTLETRDPLSLASKIAEITGELDEAFDARMRFVQRRLLKALDHQGDWAQLNERGRVVRGVGADFKLEAFATRIAEFAGAIEDLEGLLMLAIAKPSKDWTDHDVDAGEVQLVTWAFDFRRLESLASVEDRPATRRAIGVVFGAEKTISGTFDVAAVDAKTVELLARELVAKLSQGVKREVLLAAIAEAGAVVYEGMEHERRQGHA